jgi:hypothetical protein
VPASEKSQPVGTALDVPEDASVSKFWVYAEPNVVRLAEPEACTDRTGDAITMRANIIKIENTFEKPLVMFVLL